MSLAIKQKKLKRIHHKTLLNRIIEEQYELMTTLRLSHQSVYNWLNGKTTPNISLILKIQEHMDCDLRKLIEVFIKLKEGELVVVGKKGDRRAKTPKDVLKEKETNERRRRVSLKQIEEVGDAFTV